MVKSSFITTVASAALISVCTSAAGTPDDADGAQALLRKRNLKPHTEEPDPITVYEQMMAAQGLGHGLKKGPQTNALDNNRNNNKKNKKNNNGKTIATEEPDPITVYEEMMNEEGSGRHLQTSHKGPRYGSSNSNSNSNNGMRTTSSSFQACYPDPFNCGCQQVNQADYRGTMSTTISGYKCKQWTQTQEFPNSGLEDGAYCRNPNGAGESTFCFVQDNADGVHWQYCNVPKCGAESDGDTAISDATSRSSPSGVSGCVTKNQLTRLVNDVENMLDSLPNLFERSFQLGGIVRLAAHDFMDFDENASTKMGSDGCLEFSHKNNAGLSLVWGANTPWMNLYNSGYSQMSVADFWIACAMATIKIASSGAHDMMNTFMWGRKRASSCSGSGDRLPSGKTCQSSKDVFITRMGLTWKNAAALLGAHTVGRGLAKNSGHEGTWMPNVEKAMVWDKGFYAELVQRAWAPRNEGTDHQDFMAGASTSQFPKMMLNSDVCLMFDIDSAANLKCCTNINMINPEDGKNRCGIYETNPCIPIDITHERAEAAKAVIEFLGGNEPNEDSETWYRAFTEAWTLATLNGHTNLWPAQDTCS